MYTHPLLTLIGPPLIISFDACASLSFPFNDDTVDSKDEKQTY